MTKLGLFLRKIKKHIEARLFPSEHQLILRKWREDDREHNRRFNFNLGKDSIVLDVGGYQGQWASDLFARYMCNIFIFEPVPIFYERIAERFKYNEKLQVYSFGLGGYTRNESIHLLADGSSIYGDSDDLEQIKIIDVVEWLDSNFNDPATIELVKLNIEGGEYELLDRLIESGKVKNINNILVQFHKISPDSELRMEQIQSKLAETHYPTYQYKFVWESWVRKASENVSLTDEGAIKVRDEKSDC